MRNFFASLIGMIGTATFSVLMIGMFPGWAYWMWMAIQLGSFGMFFFGLAGPLGVFAGILGLWSLIFGMPMWLLKLVT